LALASKGRGSVGETVNVFARVRKEQRYILKKSSGHQEIKYKKKKAFKIFIEKGNEKGGTSGGQKRDFF